MRFLCAKNDLLEAVSSCQRAVSQRSTMAILEGILIEADNELVLTGYDTQIGIRVSCMAEVTEPGRLVINAKLINEVVRKLPDGMVVFSQKQEGLIELSAGRSSFKLKVMEAESFPKLPDVDIEKAEKVIIKQSVLKEMINKTVFAVSTDSARPNLNGALLSCTTDKASMVAIDGFRLALYTVDRDEESEVWPTIKFIIHGKTLKELVSLLREKELMTVLATSNHIMFDMGNVHLISGLIQGEFMDHTKILPKNSQSVMHVETQELLSAFERAFLMVSLEDNRFPVSLQSMDDESLQLSIDSVRGSFMEELKIKLEGEAISSDFNPRLVMDALKAIDDERIKLNFTGAVGPCVIEPEEGDGFAYLILPLRKF